jgi:hypothetical protein
LRFECEAKSAAKGRDTFQKGQKKSPTFVEAFFYNFACPTCRRRAGSYLPDRYQDSCPDPEASGQDGAITSNEGLLMGKKKASHFCEA